MNAAEHDVSIIVVSWNTCDLLLACLASIQQSVGTLSADVWVVDNGSTDQSVSAVRSQFPDVRVLVNRDNLGFAAANNQGIAASNARYVLLLNSDTVAFPNAIEQLVHFADRHPAAGVVGPMLINPDGTFQGSFLDFPSFYRELLNVTGLGRRLKGSWYPNYGPEHAQVARPVEVVQGACMLVRRSAIEHVGVMDEAYFMYSEETDWCLRHARAGWELWYLPDAIVKHYGGQSTAQVKYEMLQALYRSKVRFFRKHYGRTRALILQGLFVAVLRFKWFLHCLNRLRAPNTPAAPAIRWRDLCDPRSTELREMPAVPMFKS